MASDEQFVAVLPYAASYPDVASRLAAMGLVQAATMSFSRGPAPDQADWRGDGFEIQFDTDFSSGLKLLRATGRLAPNWSDAFTLMGHHEITQLISSEDKRETLAGLLAAQYMPAPDLLDAVRCRLLETDFDIGGEAAMALTKIAQQERQSADIWAPSVFNLLDSRKERLQIFRWLGHSHDRPNDTVLALLREQLASPDWEIRATAMGAAARMAANELIPQLATLSFPEDPDIGLGRLENRILLALRDVALQRLGRVIDRVFPPGLEAAFDGDYSELEPDVAAFVFSLLEPLPETAPPPPAAAIVLTAQGPTCGDGTLLSWVPAGAYWLGHGHRLRGEENPARRVTLPLGFYIESEAREPCDWATACVRAAERAATLGQPVAIASEDQWEMAARGPDGRRLPWGQNADPALRVDLSPLGVADLLTGPGEWLAPDRRDGTVRATPGEGRHPLSARITPPADSQLRYRFVYPFTPPQ